MLGETEGEGDEGEGGVGRAAGGVGGAAGDVEIGELVVPEVGVYDACLWICAHAEASHGVVGVDHGGWGTFEGASEPGGFGEVEAGELGAEEMRVAAGGGLLGGADAEVDVGEGVGWGRRGWGGG